MLFLTIDGLPHGWSHAIVNPATALSLPVMALTLNTDSDAAPKSFQKIRDVNIFINIDDHATLLCARLRFEMANFPFLCKKFFSVVSQLYLAPFFLRVFSSTARATLGLLGLMRVSRTSVKITSFVGALFGLPLSGIQAINHLSVPRCPLDSCYYHRTYTSPLLKKLSITIS